MARGWDRIRNEPTTDQVQETGVRLTGEVETALPTPTPLSETGASIPVSQEGVELWIRELPQGATVRVEWIDGDQVGIFAQEGTRYRTELNRLEAQGPPGDVRVELPRSLTDVLVGADDQLLLRLSGGELELPGPVSSRSPEAIVFGFEGRP
jgi:hypothetical protein